MYPGVGLGLTRGGWASSYIVISRLLLGYRPHRRHKLTSRSHIPALKVSIGMIDMAAVERGVAR